MPRTQLFECYQRSSHISFWFLSRKLTQSNNSHPCEPSSFLLGLVMSNSLGELALVLGDLHVPQRMASIPAAFSKLLQPGKMQHVLCTGNITAKEQFDELRNLAPNVHVARGDFDEGNAYPETKVLQLGAFKVGLVHGHQIIPFGDKDALAIQQRQLNCDILISGHTHKSSVTQYEGKWYINPGSITGAFSAAAGEESITPSFILLAVQGSKVVCFCYELIGDNVEVSKTEFQKAG
jgi:vacuolar protein sorting-associated protein 29